MKKMQIKAAIFDVDGVVFNSLDVDSRYLWSRTIKDDLGLSKDHFKKIFSPHWDDLVRGKIDTYDYLHNVFKDPIFDRLNITPEIYIKYWLEKDKFIDFDVLEFVRSLDIPCYLGTNQERYRTNHILQSVGDHFSGCFASCEMGAIKPEAGFFDSIQRTLNLVPTELLLIDDTRENIQGAETCGWHTYHYQGDLENLRDFLDKE